MLIKNCAKLVDYYEIKFGNNGEAPLAERYTYT